MGVRWIIFPSDLQINRLFELSEVGGLAIEILLLAPSLAIEAKDDDAARILPLVAVAVNCVLLIFLDGGALRIWSRCCGGFFETFGGWATDVVNNCCWDVVDDGVRVLVLFCREATPAVLVATIN